MIATRVLLLAALMCIFTVSNAFFASRHKSMAIRQTHDLKMIVTEVTSSAGLDQIVSSAGNKLVVVDYSTTWCGPCKLVLPKYMELSDKFANVIFLKCIGDASTEASALMKREGVRSVPTFHIWKAGSRVEVVNGARIEEVCYPKMSLFFKRSYPCIWTFLQTWYSIQNHFSHAAEATAFSVSWKAHHFEFNIVYCRPLHRLCSMSKNLHHQLFYNFYQYFAVWKNLN